MQLRLHRSAARYRIGAWGRQSGKSTWAIQELIRHAWMYPRTNYWFVSPTFDQARIMYRRMMGALWPCRQILLKRNQSELRFKFENQSQIMFKSGDNPDTLRSETLHGVIEDEVRDQHPDLWAMVLQPMLRTTGGWAAFISTPNGFDHFYDLAQDAEERIRKSQASGKTPSWEVFHSPSTCNPLFTQAEFEDAKENMAEAQFSQEIMAEFRDLTKGRVYAPYNSSVHELAQNPFAKPGERWSPYLPIVVGLDFNIGHMAWELGQTRASDWYWGQELFLPNTHTQAAGEALVEAVRGHKPGVVLVGDSTGNARQRAAAAQSDYDIVCKALDRGGIKFVNRTPTVNPTIRDRVNAVNSRLLAADGTVHFWHHPDCKALKKDLQRVLWAVRDIVAIDKGKDDSLTHASDAIGYPITELTPVPGVRTVGGLTILRR